MDFLSKLDAMLASYKKARSKAERDYHAKHAALEEKVAEMSDEIAARYPILPRDQMPQLSDEQYQAHVCATAKHRSTLLWLELFALVAISANQPEEDPVGAKLKEIG